MLASFFFFVSVNKGYSHLLSRGCDIDFWISARVVREVRLLIRPRRRLNIILRRCPFGPLFCIWLAVLVHVKNIGILRVMILKMNQSMIQLQCGIPYCWPWNMPDYKSPAFPGHCSNYRLDNNDNFFSTTTISFKMSIWYHFLNISK